jgi:hypothetical protein
VSDAVPPNGLVLYCGTVITEEGKEKKVNIDFEPFKPINTSLYLCDNKFHCEVSLPVLGCVLPFVFSSPLMVYMFLIFFPPPFMEC